MKIDLHNHTVLCNHAEGTVDAYVEKAIAEGIDVFGFSDHAPMHFDPAYRMSFEQMDAYREMVMKAQKRYAGKIDVRFAYEVDYLPGYMDDRVLNADVDYLIGSVHFIDGWGFDNPEFIGRYEHEDIDKIWRDYFGLIEAMAESRLFDIVGHLDLIKVFKFMPRTPIAKIAAPALQAIKKADMAIELNVAGTSPHGLRTGNSRHFRLRRPQARAGRSLPRRDRDVCPLRRLHRVRRLRRPGTYHGELLGNHPFPFPPLCLKKVGLFPTGSEIFRKMCIF